LSYQFAFWRTDRSLDSEQVYSQLIERAAPVAGLETLDLAEIETSLDDAFPELLMAGSLVQDGHATLNGTEVGLDVESTSQSVICTCYGMDENGLNRLLDVFIALRLPLYDPQTRERFGAANSILPVDDPDDLHALAATAFAHAIDSIPPRGAFLPFALIEDEKGVQLFRTIGDQLEVMLEGVRAHVAASSPRRAVVAWDGFTTQTGPRLDAVLVDAYESGAAAGVLLGQPYQRTGLMKKRVEPVGAGAVILRGRAPLFSSDS
jgi:hypothetical protein